MTERTIAYVDGFNLYHGLHQAAGRNWLWLDLVELVESLRPRSEIVLVRYYTAMVLDDSAAVSRQQHYLQALEARNGPRINIVRGRYQAKQKHCRSCGARWTEREEKETDVNIALGLVRDAVERRMDAALLVSADSDMAPAVRTARELRPELFLAAAFPPCRKSFELQNLMPKSFAIGQAKIRQAQMPEEFEAGGMTFRRPAKWRKVHA